MSDAIIYLDPDSELNLQAQIRQKMVAAITLGNFPRGERLPSSRKLAEQLGVARNTVVLAYQQLADEGYLVSRERSGLYVNEDIRSGQVAAAQFQQRRRQASDRWRQRFRNSATPSHDFSCPPNWQQYPYPFIEGQFDHSLYPVKEWREASRLALGVKEINTWAGETGDIDDPMLIEQIRSRILPRRGIQARPEEILVTVGTQQALYLATELLVDSSVAVAVEEPGYPGMRRLLAQRGAPVVYQPVDEEGLVVDDRLDDCPLIYVTPSHQTPTAVTMSSERRKALLARASATDALIIEDDFEFESNYLGSPHPALRSMDGEDRVIYMSCLSKVLSPGLRLGFMVAAPEVIAEARKLRRLMVRHPPLNNQRTAAFFLSLGHYDSFLMHLHRIFEQRWIALRRALNYYMLFYVEMAPAQGGTSLWVKGPEDLDVKYVAGEAARRGILIEPVDHYYATANAPRNCFRMGVTSIPHDAIRDGVLALRDLFHDLTENKTETFDSARGEHLTGAALREALAGQVMVSIIAYGDPCTIEICDDGSLVGKAGYAAEDRDQGQWWIEEDRWHRQWGRWAWGETGIYDVRREGNILKLFDEDGWLIDRYIPQRDSEPDPQIASGLTTA
ncbi:aminotransferase class I/II-fold pyridoxal phosphate-dependent enzyme [Seongchinamella sediminis]|uniref:Aminotransferase class I/II-fold pyridoxal phosphate-dependent enzyme n=1 Tax=Seongchinamella sediminis TaxID=2283635 RepID=A0A3L7E0V2_9GAMM|nr:PLP-dependent aminotransferase family protein [Seongchinamella sediminis]RLQ23408.1 aminotransferase class I/II-fold pyridoxal phosphate-dependent enzyme [Seongchinamella sediminis]